jgi:hypothetical protein
MASYFYKHISVLNLLSYQTQLMNSILFLFIIILLYNHLYIIPKTKNKVQLYLSNRLFINYNGFIKYLYIFNALLNLIYYHQKLNHLILNSLIDIYIFSFLI